MGVVFMSLAVKVVVWFMVLGTAELGIAIVLGTLVASVGRRYPSK